jgi:anhydro-N-acetylmuramic acid kinase
MQLENMTDLNKTICVAFMGILRWREEYNFLSSVTGASRSSIGGAVWLGQEA